MSKWLKVSSGLLLVLGGCGMQPDGVDPTGEELRSTGGLEPARNGAGIAETVTATGTIDRTNPFFQALGTNPRTCETCHSPAQGWALTSAAARRLFEETDGTAPLFNLVDTGNRPDADFSTEDARRANLSELLDHGVIRFGRTVAATAEFTVTNVVDPYGFGTPAAFTNFRRPTATANEALSVIITNAPGPQPDITVALAGLVRGAAGFHEQRAAANPVPADQQNAGAVMQLGIFFAQSIDDEAGRLDDDGAKGGPFNLQAQPFHRGINDIQGLDPAGQPFNHKIFDIYDAWARYARGERGHDWRGGRRAAIYRGQQIFNDRAFDISGVNGLNDQLGQPVIHGTCGTCHNTPNVGGHSVYRLFDIGTADAANCSPALPLITLQNKATMEVRQTCDMGRGGSSGKWVEIGTFRAPPLRGLAARAPYFHDGGAKTVMDAIDYHDRRFNIGLNFAERRDLEAFLNAL